MFDLEASIAQWRRQMKAAGFTRRGVLDELENHLRESVAAKVEQGAELRSAFDEAMIDLGKAGALKAEFSKLKLPEEARKKKILCLFGLLPAGAIFLAGVVAVLIVEMSWFEHVAALGVMVVVWLHLVSLPVFYWRLRWEANRFAQVMVQVGVLVAWLIAGVLIMVFMLPALKLGISPTVLWVMLASQPVICWLAQVLGDDRSGIGGEGLGPFGGGVPMPPGRPIIGPVQSLLWGKAPSPSWQIQEVLATAQEEAGRFHHDFIGTEHLLLGLLSLKQGAVAGWLAKAGVEEGSIRKEIEGIIGSWTVCCQTQTPALTPRASRALQFAVSEARALNHSIVDAGHVLVGLLREGEGVAGLVLRKLGLRLDLARALASERKAG